MDWEFLFWDLVGVWLCLAGGWSLMFGQMLMPEW